MSISDALNHGQVDLQRGLYKLPDGTYISIAEAYQKGYLIYNEIIKIKSSALSLSDAITQDLVDNSGWILDRNSGDRFQLDVAIKNELINPYVREVVDPQNDTKVTVAEAIERNIINTKHSKYVHNITKERMTFKDAASKRFICKPMTLKDICDNNLMTNDGKILSPTNRAHLNILEAISVGVLDSDSVKCITDTKTGQLLTLSEALGAKIILPDNKFRDNLTSEICTIPEAVDRGLITSVSQRSIFDIDGFRDPKTGEFVSFNVAMSKGNLKFANGETFLKAESGDFVYLEDCTKVSTVRPEVLEMFNRKIGVYDHGKELTVLEAVFKNILDPQTGYLLDSKTKKPIPFNKAVEINMITPEGAALLNSLLNITLTLQTVTKTVKRYVTVTNTGASQRAETIITFAEAVKRGLIDETTQTFTDPTTGTVFPIQQALDDGLLGVEKDEMRVVQISDRTTKKDLLPGQVVELKITKKSFIKDMPLSPESKVQYDSRPETVKSPDYAIRETSIPREGLMKEIRTVTSKSIATEPSVTSLTIKKNTIELPRGGWTLKEAIQQNLFDPDTGMFKIPGTDRVLDLEEALKLNIINPDSANAIDPNTKKEIPLNKALQLRILDNTGHYKYSTRKITMKEAIDRSYIIFVQLTTPTSLQKVITITSVAGMPDKMEISELQSPLETSSEDQTAFEPVQVAQGVIYDPATALVICTTTGVSENIVEAVNRGVVPSDTVKVIEPQTGTQIALQQALDRGIIDKKSGHYKDKSGKKISLADAAKIGLIAVVGAPLMAASKVIQVVKSTMVVDPNTGEKLPMEVAYERGLVDPVTYKQYEDSIREKTPETDFIQQGTSTVTFSQVTKPVSVGAAVSEGFITVESIQSSIASDNRKVIGTAIDKTKTHPPNVVQITKTQTTTKPKYNIHIAKERIIDTQVLDTKPVVLQKLRKRVVLPLEAVEKGMIDKDTAKILEAVKNYKDENGAPITLEIAIEKGLIDENKGKIVDPLHGDTISIKEAIDRGILDGEGQDEVLIPLAKSLSIPEVLEQGLLDPATGKIIHPETGSLLSIREAIICEIIDPLSCITIAPGQSITLAEAINRNILDNDKNIIKTSDGSLDIITAVNAQIFPEPEIVKPIEDIPPAGMTLTTAIKQKIIDPTTAEIKHPLTGERIPIKEAVAKDLIMSIPYPQSLHTMILQEALDNGAVNLKEGTFTDPKTKEIVSLEKAMEQGLLAVKPNSEIMQASGVVTTITETFTSQHTITAKMINLLPDYVLVSAHVVQNRNTGEKMSITEARQKGIVKDEQESKVQFIKSDTNITFEDALNLGYINIEEGTFTHPNTGETITISEAVSTGILNTEVPKDTGKVSPTKMNTDTLDLNDAFEYLFDENTQKFRDPKSPNKQLTFNEALEKKLINPDSVIYDVISGKPVTVKEAVDTGLIDKKTGKYMEPKTGKSVDIKNAAKMGLIAIVAAPILAGAAAVQGVKSVASKIMKPKQDAVVTAAPSRVDKVTKFGNIEVKREKDKSTIGSEVTPKPAKKYETFQKAAPIPQTESKIITEKEKSKSPTKENVPKVKDGTLRTPVEQKLPRPDDSQSGYEKKTVISETVSSQEPKLIHTKEKKQSSEGAKFQKEVEEKPIIQEFRQTMPEGDQITTIIKKTVTTSEPTEYTTEHTSTIVTTTSTTSQSDTAKYVVTEINEPSQLAENLAPRRDEAGIAYSKSKERSPLRDETKVVESKPIIEEYRHTTPEGEEVTTIVKTIISKSDPSEIVTEHTSTVITKESKVTTVEITQNESTSYKVITEEFAGPFDSTETTINQYTIEYTDSDQADKVPTNNQVSENKVVQKSIKKTISPSKEISPETKTCKKEPDFVKDNIAPKQKTPPGDCEEIDNTSKPVEVAPGVIYDPDTSVVISSTSGVSCDILQAVDKGIIPSDSITITDPKSGQKLTLKQAIEKGIVDKKSSKIKDKSGKKIKFADAVKFGLVAVVGAPVLAASKIIDVVKSAVVTDPKTGEKMPLDKARERGLIDPATYKQYKEEIKQTPTEHKVTVAEATERTSKEVDGKTSSAMLLDAERQPLRVIDEITEQNVTKIKSEPVKVLYENILLIDAIQQNKIEPKVCRIIINGIESPLTVQDSLEQEQISKFAPVDIVNKNCVIVKMTKPKYFVAISQKLTPEELSEMGIYDIEKQCFLNPDTGAKISFEELVYALHIFDPESILVKDLGSKSDNYISFDEAIARPIIDRITGHMVNPRTGKRVPFAECVQLGWIVERPDDVSVSEQVSIDFALEKGLYNPKTGEIKDVNTGVLVPIGTAIEKGLVDHESLYIKVPHTNENVPLSDAIERGIVEIHEGVITIVETHEVIEISLAIQHGLIAVTRRPVSIAAVIKNDLYEPKSGKIKDKVTDQLVTIKDAVDKNIVHPTISEIKDTVTEKFVSLSEALDTKLIHPETGKVKDKKTGKTIPLDDALKKGLVGTKDVTFTLFDIIELGYYSPDSCQVLDPKTGKTVTVGKAIKHKLIDTSDVKIKDDESEAVIPFDQAVTSGLIDLDKGILTSPVCNLKEASEKGYLLSDKKPWTLQEGLVQGIYDPETGLLTINGITMTLDEAIKGGNINPEALSVRNSFTGEIITLADAIKAGIIDSKEGKVRDPIQGDKISFTDASERGLIVPAKRKLSLPEAVFKGFYDPKTGKFSHPQSKEKVPTDRAIRKRMLDPQSTLVHVGGKVIPFEFAVDKGIVDGRTGTIVLGDEKVDFREAFERGILVEVRKPLSLIEAIEKGVYNEITGLFLDPQSGKKYTLAEAIRRHLIDPHSVHIQDNRLGKWDTITLPESIETGVLNDQSGKIRNINSDNEEISLRKAFEIGLLVDSKAPISLQRALHQGLYDDATGKIIDPATNRKITLHEALRRSIISPKYLCYFDKKSEKPLTLTECCRSEIIDRRSGKFREPGSDVQIPLSEAMSLGLIVDIESAGFTLYDALAMNMYDITELVFVHPVNERRISLQSANTEELINPETSLVKHLPSNKYIKLNEAIQNGTIDDNNSVYVLPNGNQINLVDAKHRGLIVTTKKNLNLEEIIRNGLFRADNGKIVDPSTNEYVDINKSIEIGLLNPDSTVVKDSFTNKFKPLPIAIQQGDVDVNKGRVLDTKAKKTYSLDIAFDKGLLVTVNQPLTSQTVTKRYVPESSATKESVLREFTLDEAIKYEFIDPETALIKDPHKNKYIPLKLGISEGIIDKNAKGSFDTQRSKTLCFLFENGLIVYVREPLTFEQAIENGHLNIVTARFTDPLSNEVLTIKDAATLGYIDPDTALIKDNLKKRLVKLPEAFRKGLMDAEKGNILDTETSKLNTLQAAIESGLLITPKKSFSLIETLNFGIYNPTTGALNDPFITTSVIDRKRLSLGEAIQQGIVDPSSTVVKEPQTGKIWPLVQAIEQKLVDPVAGRLTIDPVKSISLDLVKAHKKGYLLPAETRQAVEEKYRLCDETLSKLLEWIAIVEERLANQEPVKEDLDELRNQINILKLIKDDLESHQRQVSSCADQAKQLLVSGGDVLAPHEVAALERGVRQLKQRCDKCTEKCDKMLRKLAAARDELGKFSNELNTFNTWMEGAYRTLEDKESQLSKLNNLPNQSQEVREFVSDVIAHQADLRFITMAAQKFVDESKEFLNVVNEYRTSLPSRLSHVPAPGDSAVREAAALAKRRHAELAARAQRLHERLRGAAHGSQHYHDALDRADRWLKEIEPQARSVLSEGVAGEPRAVESQLSRAKALHTEILAQGRLIDNAKDACDQLVKSLEGNLTPSEIRQLEVPVLDLTARYKDLVGAVGARCSELEGALLQCQGLQDAAEAQAHWLGQAENAFKNQFKPASLIRERLDEQVREHRLAQNELEARRPTLAKLVSSARDAALNPSNARIAKKLEQRAEEIYARYEKLLERSMKRSQFLDEVSSELAQFAQKAARLDAAHAQLLEQADSRELARMPAEELRARLSDLAHFRDKHLPLLEECLRIGKQLIAKKDVTDTHAVRDRIKQLENQWRDFNSALEEKQKLSKQRADQLSQYEGLRAQVLEWLQAMENRVGRLQPVAVDLDIMKQQQDELRPLTKEYRDFSVTIEKVNEAGEIYEALTRGDRADSPHRKRQVYSPTKRQTPIRTLDGRSPSPTKGHGLVSPGSTHSTSSGFSSRRSSQDGFHLEELSPVQQQLSEINNRYSLLGTKLTDRQSELDALREELRKHLDSCRQLNQFLDKVQRQLPKDSVPNTKEEADKTIKQARAILEEMYEKQSILDSTKTQVRELVKRKQGVQGADRLHSEMEDVASRWKALHDAFKDRIRLMEEMKDFHDTHINLTQWLNSKDRMMAALGPISSDSRMVQTQVQQVQVLREEFRSQQPQLAHLEEVASDILSRLDPRSPDAAKLKQKVKDLQDRWNDLLNKLEKRAESLGAAADTSREFDAGLARLRDALQTISDKLDDVALEKEPDEQLRKIENLERQLEGQRPLLADLESAGATLATVLSDPASRQDIQSKLAAVARQYDNLQRKLDHRKAEIEAALKDGRNLEETVAKTLGWLQSELGALPGRLQVSADSTKLQQQLDKHEPLYRDLTKREHEIIMLLDKGREMEKKPAHQGLRKDLDRIQTQWEKLKRETVDRHTRLQTAMEHCRKYSKAQESFLPWLSSAEDRLAKLPAAAFTKKEVEKQLRELQQIRNDIWKRSGEYENNKTLGETFISACDVDQEIVRKQLDSMKERWDRLNNEVLHQVEFLESTARKLGEFAEKVRAVETPLTRCEERLQDALAAPPAMAAEAVARIVDQIHALKAPLQSINSAADDIVTLALECAGPDASARARHVLEEQAQALGDRVDDLEARAGEAKDRLAGAAVAMQQFQDKVKSLSHDLSDLDKELDAMKPPGRDIKTVKQQLDDIGRFYKRLEKADDLVGLTERAAESLIDSGHSVDSAKTRDQVEGLRKQLAKLDERARAKEQDLDDTLSKLEAFYKAYDSVMEDVQEAAEQVRSLKPVSSEVEQIRAQQKDFAELKRRTLEPLGQNVAHCNKIGQGLVRSALQGVSTQQLEKDLEKMNDKWNALKEKMNERERRLDVGLLQSGKFAEALAGLEKWLADTEDMVNNQKPPSADYKVVKAQLQEQKFLKKMLMDRQNSMSSLFAMGNEVAAGCEPGERKAIEKQLKGLMQRFDALTNGAQQRMLDLEQAMKVAKQFQEQLQPLLEWLDTTERKVKGLELVPTDEEKIQQKIREHKILHDDILSKQPPFKQLTETAQILMGLVGDDEAAALADRLQAATDRYQALVDHSLNVGELLDNSRKGLRHLVLTYQDLSAWMDGMEQYLAKRKILPVHMDKLLRQMDELAEKTEEIASKQEPVDSTVEAGLELMKHISGDEALQLKDKLDALQRRYNDLTSKGAELLRIASETLPLVQQKARDRQSELEDALREAQSFNAEIGDLLSWLSEVDSVIAASKPVGGLPETASEQLERFMEVYNEIEANRPKVEAVLQQGQEYLRRQEKPNPTSQLHHNLKTLKSRWDNVTARASDKKIKLEIALKEATEFHDALQAFVDWLTSAEKTLTSAKPVSRVMETLLTQIEEHKSFQKEVSTHRETMLHLDKKGTHLKYFSQKQDVILIKNLLVSVQHRWERVVAKAAERTRALDHGFKEAKEFSDMWNNLMNWLKDTEKQLDELNSEATVNDPDKIKQRLNKHREFQKALAAKQPVYDQTMKTGKNLKDKAPKGDEPTLKNMLTDLKSKWTTVCSKAVDRQRKLEEALLYSGQFKDAMSALLDWLKKQQKQLSADSPVHGDLDTVMALIEQHKQFEEDLHSREQQMQSVLKTGRELEATVPREDASNIKQQCSELKTLWESVQTLSERKAHKLESALKEAEKLHKSVNMLLEWLSDAETKLRFSGQLPEGDQETLQQIREHERFIRELKEKQRDKDDTITLAHSILGKAHPDAVTVIKHWITIIQSRWDEVWQWAMQRGSKLETHMQSLKDLDLVLEELLQWLIGLENTLLSLEAEPLPESIELLEGLIEDHKELMEHTQKRQTEVDRVCKAYQVKSQSQGRESTPRKVSAKTATKGQAGRGSQHDLNRERSVSPDYYGSRRYRIHSRSRKGSRVSPGRETPDRNLPHYGPRFPPKGSKGAEPEFRSPRVKQLWDKWRNVWLLAWERQRRLHERLAHLKELQRVSNFSWDDWRKRFLKFMNHKKSRLTDLFRKMDKDNNGLIPRNEFIDGIINTKFDTSRLEMGAVADLFDRNGSGLIDWEEFIAALRPDWVERRGPPTDADKIHDEVKRLVMLCTCRQKFRVFQVGEGKYRFGDSQKLRLVRILRSTVMVRVGGGWVALDEFLVKNDPCRAEEFMEQLRPIFEALRQREELPCSYPLHVGSTHGTKQAFIYGHSRSQGSTTPGAHHYTHHHGYQPSPGYHWVRERTARSVPMSSGAGRASRSSLSAGTPDSLSDNEAASGLGARYKKPSVPRSTLTPGGSRPGSRTGSKPPSRHGSNLSLDSTDDVGTPSRIPMRKVTNTRASIARAAATASKLGVATPNGGSRPRTPTGFSTPASGRYHGAMYRTSSIPTLTPVPALVSSTHSQPSSMASEHPKSMSLTHPAFQTQGSTKIPVYIRNRSQRTPSVERKKSKIPHSIDTSQNPSPTSQYPSRKSEQRSPEDDSSLFSISGMTSDNEYESNISESSGESSKPTQRAVKGSGSFASTEGQTPGRSRIPVLKDHHTNNSANRQRTPSGSTTPVRPGQQTAVSRLRKTSDASDSGTPTTPGSRRGTPSSTKSTEIKREPFRL
ncbi:microtubule-actin cross-linking factor 1, isoforms 1/2/3/5 isoform X13 [Hyposmocoma kahamanoa]|uniref:microtubule-actin cross-linking factor 1, isoforms 1/2/3/5 isoform X13 n=1 Tax=Hyposmocoma kahamanoa TaxID=1477025 RepID=UPI000E6D8AEC|nr:microtubule-actin cross-linking factor 1, isoforms 1/2/3/5 isoform X13 [Hyposmocoma kahamanoa]